MRTKKQLKEENLRTLKQLLEYSRKNMELEDKVNEREKAFLEADKLVKKYKLSKETYLEEVNKHLYRNDYGNANQVLDIIRELTRAFESAS